MRPTRPKRSRLVTIVALIFLGWGGLAVLNVVIGRAWDPDSGFWDHSDAMWAWEYIGPPTLEEQRLSAAQARAQMRYELPIKGTLMAWSLVAFVASLGLLRRKNWARLLFIGLMAFAVLGMTWGIVVLTPLRLADKTDIVESVVIAVVCGSIAWKLRSPSVVSEFRNERS
ncbi:MAG: hypothetical protein WDO56_34955 [Gammaproteobacteria bacterium]